MVLIDWLRDCDWLQVSMGNSNQSNLAKCSLGPSSHPPNKVLPYLNFPATCSITPYWLPWTHHMSTRESYNATILKCIFCSFMHTILILNHKLHSANPNWSQLVTNLSCHTQFRSLQMNHLSQIGGPIPAQPNFYTLYKSEQCSSKHE